MNWKRFIPIERCWRVKLHFRSGLVIRFSAKNVTYAEGLVEDHLTKLHTKFSRGFPSYFCMADVCAMRVRSGYRFRWRKYT